MDKSFSVIDVLETSWDITRKNFLVIIGYSLLSVVSIAIFNFIYLFSIETNIDIFKLVGFIIFLIVLSTSNLGFYKLVFTLIDNDDDDDFSIKSILPTWKNIFSFIILVLIFSVLVVFFSIIYKELLNVTLFDDFINFIKADKLYFGVAAFIAFLLILIMSMRFMFFPCFIVDDDSSAFESLRQSRTLTQDNLLKIIAVLGIVIGFIALGFLALGVGIIVTYPFTNIILVVTYRKLVNNYTAEHQEESIAEESNGD